MKYQYSINYYSPLSTDNYFHTQKEALPPANLRSNDDTTTRDEAIYAYLLQIDSSSLSTKIFWSHLVGLMALITQWRIRRVISVNYGPFPLSIVMAIFILMSVIFLVHCKRSVWSTDMFNNDALGLRSWKIHRNHQISSKLESIHYRLISPEILCNFTTIRWGVDII
jgi:hypothetical protein